MKVLNDLAILILAGGESKRLGFSKQLFRFQGISLLQGCINKSRDLCDFVYVVLGNDVKRCYQETKGSKIIFNENFKNGIGSSIKKGIKELLDFEFILIMPCDYPLLPKEHLRALIERRDFEKIIATFCDGTLSSPAVFPKKFYPLLLELDDKKGAKEIIQKYPNIFVELEKKYFLDIDTKEDIKKLSRLKWF